MSWPLASHFSAMLQNPRLAFRDPVLRQCHVERDQRGQPRPWAGAFAVVYKAFDPNRGEPFAVRIFTTESPERRERYDLISGFLKGRNLNSLVEFEYRDASLRSASDGKWYPMILMQWVQGDTLFHWVRARCLQRDKAALASCAQRWVVLVRELTDNAIAHGDLQHANVMVTPAGELKLVDYDCMCVPSLVGRRNLEVGVEPYQHPTRNAATLLSLDLDNFSALTIYVALRALAVKPELWDTYVENPGYDKLLFRPDDFRSPTDSPLYNELIQSPEQDVRELTHQLFSFLHVPMNQVPPLGHLANSFAKVEALLKAQRWNEAVELLNRRGQFRDAPEHLQPLIRQAYEHVCRRQAWDAFLRVPQETSEASDRQLVNAWNEPLFAGFEPAERQRIWVGEARRRVQILDRIYHQVQQSAAGITLVGERGIVEAASHLPEGYHYSLQGRVTLAMRREKAVNRLLKAIQDGSSEAAIVASWRAVAEMQCEALVDSGLRPRVEMAQRRAPLIRALEKIPKDLPSEQYEQRVLEIWQDELLSGCREADVWRTIYQRLGTQHALQCKIEAAVKADDESALLPLVGDPALDDLELSKATRSRLESARTRLARAEPLLNALRQQNLEAFVEHFDVAVIRLYARQFAPYGALLRDWVTQEILPVESLGLHSAGRRSVKPVKQPPETHRVRWHWPESRYCDRCVVVVCSEEPAENEDPRQLSGRLSVDVDRRRWHREGQSLLLSVPEDLLNNAVVVWAVMDLGFAMLYSAPVVLGRIEEGTSWSLPRLGWLSSHGGDASKSDDDGAE